MTERTQPGSGFAGLLPVDPPARVVIHRAEDLRRWIRRSAKDPGYAAPGQVERWREELEVIRRLR